MEREIIEGLQKQMAELKTLTRDMAKGANALAKLNREGGRMEAANAAMDLEGAMIELRGAVIRIHAKASTDLLTHYPAFGAEIIAFGPPRSVLVPLSCNFIATLAVCGAMDLAWLDRNSATAWMMINDFSSGVWLLFRPGLPRVVAMFYAITLPVYAATLSFTLPQVVSFGLITAIAFLQLGVVTIDTFTGSGGNTGGKRGRNRILGFCLDLSDGRGKMVQRSVAGDTAARCGGLDGR